MNSTQYKQEEAADFESIDNPYRNVTMMGSPGSLFRILTCDLSISVLACPENGRTLHDRSLSLVCFPLYLSSAELHVRLGRNKVTKSGPKAQSQIHFIFSEKKKEKALPRYVHASILYNLHLNESPGRTDIGPRGPMDVCGLICGLVATYT
ncbi:hypothetical protein BD289DRAFT_169841 [Coniella lustricola]|uniref:Uncharacterized protein n=1 Tax=Coniella lustricola TaxID=2025994 RepID=A0A2T2ZTY9_9PEZI|nr:hypothetical protein BD289DRAFT_169841 [Coniella lustricola]